MTNKVPTGDRKTYVSFLLDETGSMQAIKSDTLGGFNAYLGELRKSPNIVTSLVTFNSSETKVRWTRKPAPETQDIVDTDYEPAASTPLIDASFKIIRSTETAVAEIGADTLVVVVIQTDGEENVSTEHTREELAALIKEKQAAGWQFVFLGANLDAFQASRGLNVPHANVMSYSGTNSRQAMMGAASNLRCYSMTGMKAALSFTATQRQEAREGIARKSSQPVVTGAPKPTRKSTAEQPKL